MCVVCVCVCIIYTGIYVVRLWNACDLYSCFRVHTRYRGHQVCQKLDSLSVARSYWPETDFSLFEPCLSQIRRTLYFVSRINGSHLWGHPTTIYKEFGQNMYYIYYTIYSICNTYLDVNDFVKIQ